MHCIKRRTPGVRSCIIMSLLCVISLSVSFSSSGVIALFVRAYCYLTGLLIGRDFINFKQFVELYIV